MSDGIACKMPDWAGDDDPLGEVNDYIASLQQRITELEEALEAVAEWAKPQEWIAYNPAFIAVRAALSSTEGAKGDEN